MNLSKKRNPNSQHSSDDEIPKKRRRKSSASSTSNAYVAKSVLAELEMQKNLANDVVICGVPMREIEDLREMFLRLCKNMCIAVSPQEISSIYRKNDLIVIRFRNRSARDLVFHESYTKQMWTDDIVRLRSGDKVTRIYITYHVTEHFSWMLSVARRAYKDKMICHYEINDHGFGIRSTAKTPMDYFLSVDELDEYIDELYMSSMIWSRSAS